MSSRNTPQRKANGGTPKVHRSPRKSRKPIPEIKVYVIKTEKDVLLGRGGESNAHLGNQRYLKEVKRLAPAYGNASKPDKTKISENVCEWVSQELGGRFIQKEEGTDKWFIAHDDAARDKASQALREAYKKLQFQDTAAGAGQAATHQAPESIVSEAELVGLFNRDGGIIFDGIDVTSEGTGSQALGSSTSVDGSYDNRDETHQEHDHPSFEELVTMSANGHVYENFKVAAKRAPPRDEDDDDGPFAAV